jgi:hypothetical protein
MVYLVGGYKLTPDQARNWCSRENLQPPPSNISLFVNRWLREKNIKTRLLACGYCDEDIFLVVTTRRIDPAGKPTQFEPFKEDDKARFIKKQIGIENVEFVTVPNPYG